MKREEQRFKSRGGWDGEVSFDVNEKIQADEDIEVLELAMQQITGEQRAIYTHERSRRAWISAIASVLGIPEGTVGSRLNKARETN